MQVQLKLFFKWGITFDEEHPYTVADHGARKVKYAEKEEIISGIIQKYRPELAALPPDVPPADMREPWEMENPFDFVPEADGRKLAVGGLQPFPKARRPVSLKTARAKPDEQV